MKKVLVQYQVYVQCSQEIQIPDDIEITKRGYEGLVELREKIPDHEIWDLIPDHDGHGEIYIEDHLDFVNGSGLDIPHNNMNNFHFDIEVYSI